MENQDFNLDAMTVSLPEDQQYANELQNGRQGRATPTITIGVWTITLALTTGSGVVPYTTSTV